MRYTHVSRFVHFLIFSSHIHYLCGFRWPVTCRPMTTRCLFLPGRLYTYRKKRNKCCISARPLTYEVTHNRGRRREATMLLCPSAALRGVTTTSHHKQHWRSALSADACVTPTTRKKVASRTTSTSCDWQHHSCSHWQYNDIETHFDCRKKFMSAMCNEKPTSTKNWYATCYFTLIYGKFLKHNSETANQFKETWYKNV